LCSFANGACRCAINIGEKASTQIIAGKIFFIGYTLYILYVLRPFSATLFLNDGRNIMRTGYTRFFPVTHLSGCVFCAALLLCAVIVGACRDTSPPRESNEPNRPQSAPAQEQTASAEVPAEMNLFDGKTLGDWEITDFGGQGKVYVKDGAIYLEQGNDMTGITWRGPLIRMNYEITLEAMRVSGSDFFCGLTFPVNENHCSLILGGWGGTVCGLSNIDYYDAANNETTRIVSFDTGKWPAARHAQPNSGMDRRGRGPACRYGHRGAKG
jgi:hypothetical protein